MIRQFCLILGSLLFTLNTAYGWWSANNPDASSGTANRDIVDVQESQKMETSDKAILKVDSLARSDDRRVCDFVAEVTASNGDSFGIEKDYLEKKVIRPRRSYTHYFVFYKEDWGPGFLLSKDSLKVKGSCLGVRESEDVADVPSPHTICDPDLQAEGCGITCKGSVADGRCDSPDFPWPTSLQLFGEATPLHNEGWMGIPSGEEGFAWFPGNLYSTW